MDKLVLVSRLSSRIMSNCKKNLNERIAPRVQVYIYVEVEDAIKNPNWSSLGLVVWSRIYNQINGGK